MGSIPGQGTKIPHAMLCSLKMKKKKYKKKKKEVGFESRLLAQERN